MSFAEDEYVRSKKKKNPLTPFLPVLGLVLAVALGAIAFILSKPAHEFLMKQIETFPQETEVQYVVAGALFIVFLLFAGLIYAIFAPKQEKLVTERELKKEKDYKEKERLAAKKRKRQIQAKMAAERSKKSR